MSAKNITVITLSGQEVHRTLKKAKQLASKGNHVWRGDFTLLEVMPRTSEPDYARLQLPGQLAARTRRAPAAPYIPETMPPPEVPGVWFEEPNSDTWRLQHRNVAFSPQVSESVVTS